MREAGTFINNFETVKRTYHESTKFQKHEIELIFQCFRDGEKLSPIGDYTQ